MQIQLLWLAVLRVGSLLYALMAPLELGWVYLFTMEFHWSHGASAPTHTIHK